MTSVEKKPNPTSFCTVQKAECGFAMCCRVQVTGGFKKDKTGN